jgi:hypothetical protein
MKQSYILSVDAQSAERRLSVDLLNQLPSSVTKPKKRRQLLNLCAIAFIARVRIQGMVRTTQQDRRISRTISFVGRQSVEVQQQSFVRTKHGTHWSRLCPQSESHISFD